MGRWRKGQDPKEKEKSPIGKPLSQVGDTARWGCEGKSWAEATEEEQEEEEKERTKTIAIANRT